MTNRSFWARIGLAAVAALLVVLLSGCLVRLARSPYCGHGTEVINGKVHVFQGERGKPRGTGFKDHNVLIVYPAHVGDGEVEVEAIAINCH